MNENKLPQWAIDGLKEAGLSADGWRSNLLCDTLTNRADASITVTLHRADLGNARLVADFSVPISEAFRLAAALSGKPDPRIKELEAEVARLREVVESTHVEGIGRWIDRSMLDLPLSHATPLTQEDFDRDAEIDRLACEVAPDADAKGGDA